MRYLIIALSVLFTGCATVSGPVVWTEENSPLMVTKPDPKYAGLLPMICIEDTDVCQHIDELRAKAYVAGIVAMSDKIRGNGI